MRATRARFKLMLKRCKANESQMKSDAIVNKHRSKKVASFWCDVKSMKCANNNLVSKVDEASTPAGTADLFKISFPLFCLKIRVNWNLRIKFECLPYLG